MHDDLVRRLRKLHDTIEEMEPFSIPQLAEAADAIEDLAAQLEEARAALQEVCDHCPKCDGEGEYEYGLDVVSCEFCETARAYLEPGNGQ